MHLSSEINKINKIDKNNISKRVHHRDADIANKLSQEAV